MLEEHPETFGQQGNRFYILGRLMGKELAKGREGEPPFRAVGNPGDGTWFGETGHTLRNGPAPFRDFWLNNGALPTDTVAQLLRKTRIESAGKGAGQGSTKA